MLERAFRVDERVVDDLGNSQRTVSRRRERCFMLKRTFRVGESATDDPTDGRGTFRVDENDIFIKTSVSRRRERRIGRGRSKPPCPKN